jgi:hypothetical protein
VHVGVGVYVCLCVCVLVLMKQAPSSGLPPCTTSRRSSRAIADGRGGTVTIAVSALVLQVQECTKYAKGGNILPATVHALVEPLL